jgi:hypothetical protein
MSNSVKYIASLFLLTGAIGLYVFKGWSNGSDGSEIPDDPAQSFMIEESFDFEDLLSGINELQTSDSTIIPVMILSPTACVPCINNVADYRDLVNKEDFFHELTLVFINEDDTAVNRFIMTTSLSVPYLNVKYQKDDDHPFEPLQHLVFYDTRNQSILYTESVPNVVTTLESKEQLLADVMRIANENDSTMMIN